MCKRIQVDLNLQSDCYRQQALMMMRAPVQIAREEQKVLLVSWMFSENLLEKTSKNALWVTFKWSYHFVGFQTSNSL